MAENQLNGYTYTNNPLPSAPEYTPSQQPVYIQQPNHGQQQPQYYEIQVQPIQTVYVEQPAYIPSRGDMVEVVVPGRQDIAIVEVGPQYVHGLPTEPYGPNSEKFYCTTCGEARHSVVEHRLGLGAWLWIIFWLFFFFPFAFFPFCFPDCQDTVHRCPVCGKVVGKREFGC